MDLNDHRMFGQLLNKMSELRASLKHGNKSISTGSLFYSDISQLRKQSDQLLKLMDEADDGSTGIEYKVSIDLYQREYMNAMDKVTSNFGVADMKLIKEYVIARDWFIHNPEFGDRFTLNVGELCPHSK